GSARPKLAGARRVVATLEVDPAVAEERHEDLERLLEPVDAMVVGVAERRVLRRMGAAPEAEDQPALAHLAGSGDHLREEPGIAKPSPEDEAADRHPQRPRGQRAEERPRLPGPAGLALRDAPVRRVADDEVVRNEQRIEPDRLGELG